jgi:hypothetical protein
VLADGSGVWFQRRTAPAPSRPGPGAGAGSSPARPALVASVLISRPHDGGEGFELHHGHVIGGRAVQVPGPARAEGPKLAQPAAIEPGPKARSWHSRNRADSDSSRGGHTMLLQCVPCAAA